MHPSRLQVFLISTTIFTTALIWAQANQSADEQAIRAVIAKIKKSTDVPFTEDVVFAGGAYAEPIVGVRQLQTERQKKRDTPTTRRENEIIETEIRRIDVAASGDMAYEFSKTHLTFDEGGKHSDLNGYMLRVWKKVNGDWRVAATMARAAETAR